MNHKNYNFSNLLPANKPDELDVYKRQRIEFTTYGPRWAYKLVSREARPEIAEEIVGNFLCDEFPHDPERSYRLGGMNVSYIFHFDDANDALAKAPFLIVRPSSFTGEKNIFYTFLGDQFGEVKP